MGRRIKFVFGRGGEVRADLLEGEAPKVCSAIWVLLPVRAWALHSRWSGREVNFPINTGQCKPPRENLSLYVSRGDVAYWRLEGSDERPEALALYYGAEEARDWRGQQPVSIFARVVPEDLSVLEEVGLRIWQQGGEPVLVEVCSA